ncbi:hypothetical protein H0H87_008751 [Tephrocybe sp. NHM501043]|nr:hypothetical protein H0H87_008751 [Tephrocybe sp. NHM501043]
MQPFCALLILVIACTAQLSASEPQRADEAYISEDPKCPKGFYSGFESNVWQFAVPAPSFIKQVGTFFHSEWYAGVPNATHGNDDTIGATRTLFFKDRLLVERLIGTYRSPTQYVQHFSRAQEKPVTIEDFTLLTYTEEHRVMSICGGAAVHYAMTATYCTDKVVVTYDFYDRYRKAAMQILANQTGALIFEGTCPLGESDSFASLAWC